MSPSETLEKIIQRFERLGLYRHELTVTVGGASYRIALNPDSFVVYRINHCKGHKHHVPGWPVCLVTREAIFEECFDTGLGKDHCSCGITIEQWIEIAKKNI
ncbi:MAG: hypothetical protein ACP5VS_17675 [Desulfomonilaceae bacterium]